MTKGMHAENKIIVILKLSKASPLMRERRREYGTTPLMKPLWQLRDGKAYLFHIRRFYRTSAYQIHYLDTRPWIGELVRAVVCPD